MLCWDGLELCVDIGYWGAPPHTRPSSFNTAITKSSRRWTLTYWRCQDSGFRQLPAHKSVICKGIKSIPVRANVEVKSLTSVTLSFFPEPYLQQGLGKCRGIHCQSGSPSHNKYQHDLSDVSSAMGKNEGEALVNKASWTFHSPSVKCYWD